MLRIITCNSHHSRIISRFALHNCFLQKYFSQKGVGTHKHYLTSFELALRSAGIAPYNLLSVSSIYPPRVKRITKDEGIKLLPPGSVVPAVIARNATNEPNRLISASIGVAIPNDPNQYGYLSEHHPFGETDEKSGEYAEDLAATMLATILGIEFDPEKSWDERESNYTKHQDRLLEQPTSLNQP